MKITSIRFDFNFEPSPGVGELWAFASLELDKELVVRRVRVVGYADGRVRVYMPSKTITSNESQKPTGLQFQDIVFPVNKNLKDRMFKETLKALMRVLCKHRDIKRVEQIANALIQLQQMGESCQK